MSVAWSSCVINGRLRPSASASASVLGCVGRLSVVILNEVLSLALGQAWNVSAALLRLATAYLLSI